MSSDPKPSTRDRLEHAFFYTNAMDAWIDPGILRLREALFLVADELDKLREKVND